MSFLFEPDSPAAKYFNIEKFDDPDFRVYHSGLRLLDEGYQHLEAYKGVELVDSHTALPGLMEFALGINGVTWVCLASHTLSVRKSPLFKWDDIDQQLVELWVGIKAALDLDDLMKLEDPRPDPLDTKPSSGSV